MLALEYQPTGKNNGNRIWHSVARVEEKGRASVLVTACGMRLPNRQRKVMCLHLDEYQRCPDCRRERLKGYRRYA